uniref:Uncharacterized protein n=1 Tax=Arundo donax TaxID=35708 RepID=A0A0A9FV37_ARUDO
MQTSRITSYTLLASSSACLTARGACSSRDALVRGAGMLLQGDGELLLRGACCKESKKQQGELLPLSVLAAATSCRRSPEFPFPRRCC